MKDHRQFLLVAVSMILIVACTTMSGQAQQRDPNQPRPTPTPTPTPQLKTPNRRVVTTTSDVGKVVSPTTMPGIYGQIRWKKALGLPFDPSRVRPPYPICNMFQVRITLQDPGAPGTFGAARTLGNFDASGNPADNDDYYVCSYGLPDKGLLPRNRTMLVSVELDTRVLRGVENAQWSVGSDTMPPPGQQRTIIIIGGRDAGIALTETQLHATLDFEMVYRSIPQPPR